jgi:membrane fusion protein, heavy metal efflux system
MIFIHATYTLALSTANVVASLVFFLFVSTAAAGPGHDHGDEAPKTQGAASPRFETHSDLFELVGIYEKGGVTLYLDRYKSNEPVANAKIEFEAAGLKGVATAQPDNTYRIESDALKVAKGTLAFAFTITQGNDADLLAANLAFGTQTPASDPHAHDHSHSSLPAWAYALISLLILAITALIVLLVKRHKAARALT